MHYYQYHLSSQFGCDNCVVKIWDCDSSKPNNLILITKSHVSYTSEKNPHINIFKIRDSFMSFSVTSERSHYENSHLKNQICVLWACCWENCVKIFKDEPFKGPFIIFKFILNYLFYISSHWCCQCIPLHLSICFCHYLAECLIISWHIYPLWPPCSPRWSGDIIPAAPEGWKCVIFGPFLKSLRFCFCSSGL